MRLAIGGGRSGAGYDKAIDIYPYEGVTDIVDIAVEPLPYEANTFNEIQAHHVLEHIPTVIYWKEDGKFHRRYCRVEVMREIHRVLTPGGTLIASVPVHWPNWAQDPTHADVPWQREQFSYFCGQWGGNEPGSEQHNSYGINFAFEWVNQTWDETEKNITVWLRKR